ncbi:MAG: TonB family protein [bacterium]
MRTVLQEITTQSGAGFVFSDALVSNQLVTCRFKDLQLSKALNKILRGFDIAFRIYNENSAVLFKKEKPPVEDFKPAVVNIINLPEKDTIQELTRPIVLNNKTPVYPVEAIVKKYEGKVSIKLFVTKEGSVSKMEINKSSGYPILDSATVSYSEKLKFIPAKLNGDPHSAWVEMTFNYHFRDN